MTSDNDTLYKLDFHVHAAERSGCATAYEEHQIQSALAAGLAGIAFTDHHAMASHARLDELNRKYAPFRIFAGIEITADKEDWLVLGLREPELARAEKWSYPELREFVRRKDGFIILAHPFRYADSVQVDIGRQPPDAIEYRSSNTPVGFERDIRALAGRYGMTLMCNSDAHSPKHLGTYFNLLAEMPADDRDLVEALRRMKGG